MKYHIKLSILLTVLLVLIFLYSGCKFQNKSTGIKNSSTEISTNNSTVNISKDKYYSYEDFFPNKQDLFISYEALLKLYGKPIKAINVKNDNLIATKGYFVTLFYDGLEFSMYCGDFDKKFKLENSEAVQVDITSSIYATGLGIKTGDKLDKIEEKYDIKAVDIKSSEGQELKQKLNRFRRDNTYNVYTKAAILQSPPDNNKPVAMVLLFDNNILKRISILMPNAD